MKSTLILALVAFLPSISHAGKKVMAPHPFIQSQKQDAEGVRHIKVLNPTGRRILVFFECENVMSVDPVPVSARKLTTVQLRAQDPVQGECFMMHWEFRDKRKTDD